MTGADSPDGWNAQWITAFENQSESNTWICFRREFEVPEIKGTAIARIAADSKYWLWINGETAVFEGGLKRGPAPSDTYYDEMDLAPYLKEGNNSIALLLWYFGKDGFSHKSSGKAGVLFECNAETFRLRSDRFDPRQLEPDASDPLEALNVLVRGMTERSGAVCLPSQEIMGGSFQRFDSLEEYEREILLGFREV